MAGPLIVDLPTADRTDQNQNENKLSKYGIYYLSCTIVSMMLEKMIERDNESIISSIISDHIYCSSIDQSINRTTQQTSKQD